MRRQLCGLLLVLGLGGLPVRADDYDLDKDHASIVFSIQHLGLSYTYGRFNVAEGAFVIDKADPAKSSFKLKIAADSIDTASSKRDDHLRSPDFLDVKTYPYITFESKAVKAAPNGYTVTGDFTLHGVTKSITFPLVGGKTAEFPPGMHRIGFSAQPTIKRSDYGMSKLIPAVGDDVHILISFEGLKKK